MSNIAVVLIVVGFLVIVGISIWYVKRGLKNTPVVYPTMKGSYSPRDFSILNIINKEREFNKLGKLSLDDTLSLTIGKHIDMCRLVEKISHQDIESRFTELKESLPVRRLGEIVVYGHKDTESLVEKLLASSSHKEIILGDYNKIGISAKLDFHNKMYVGLILMK